MKLVRLIRDQNEFANTFALPNLNENQSENQARDTLLKNNGIPNAIIEESSFFLKDDFESMITLLKKLL